MMYIFQFVIGSCLGSFAYCFAFDWVHQQICLTRRSTCDHCSTTLKAFDLIPIVSQVLSRFRCRYCQKPTSSFYIIVEVMSGLLFVWTSFVFKEYHIYFIMAFALVSLLMIYCDIHAMMVPDMLQLILLCLVLYIVYVSELDFGNQLLLALATFSSFFVFNTLRPASIGGADIKVFTILSLCIPVSLFPMFLFITSTTALFYFLFGYLFRFKSTGALPFFPFIFFGLYCILSI